MDILTFTVPDLAPSVRIVMNRGNEPRFIVKDVCDILGLDNPTMACKRLPPEDVELISIDPNSKIEMLTVTEAGMYWLIIRSDKPKARPLIMWVTHEVLPALRRTGQYVMPRNGRQQNATKWGEQPLKSIVYRHGYTGTGFVRAANSISDLPESLPRFTGSNYSAWVSGTCLPAETLIVRAEKLLGVPRTQLFTPEVLAAMPNRGVGRRQQGPSQISWR